MVKSKNINKNIRKNILKLILIEKYFVTISKKSEIYWVEISHVTKKF